MKSNLYSKVEVLLKNYKTLKCEIKSLNIDIEEIEKEYKGISAISYEEKTGPTNAFSSSVENEVIQKSKKLDALRDIKRRKELQVERVENALEVLNEKEYKIIELKYFSERKKSWSNVCAKTDMCEAWCRQLKDRAIKKMIPIFFVSESTSGKVAK